MSSLQQFITNKTPEGWTTRPFWSLFQRVKFTGFADEELLSVYRDYGVIPKSSRDDNHNKASEDLSNYQLIDKGWLVTNKMKAWQGSIAISRHRGIVSPAYYAYKPLSQEYDQFLHYLLRSSNYIALYGHISKGVRVNQWDLEHEALRSIPVLLPPYETQKEIADFLDCETVRIDQLIAKKKAVLNLLTEREKSIGIDLFTGRNTSLDEQYLFNYSIPSDWKISKHARHFQSRMGETILKEDLIDEGKIPVYSATERDTIFGCVDLANSLLREGDIVIPARGNCIGAVKYISEPAASTQTTIQTRCIDARINNKFAYYWLKIFREHLFAFDRTAIPQVTVEQISNNPFVIPPLDIQAKLIGDYEIVVKKNQSLYCFIEKTLKVLLDFKNSIITEAVTGQLDIQKWRQRGVTDRHLDKIEEDIDQSKRVSA